MMQPFRTTSSFISYPGFVLLVVFWNALGGEYREVDDIAYLDTLACLCCIVLYYGKSIFVIAINIETNNIIIQLYAASWLEEL